MRAVLFGLVGVVIGYLLAPRRKAEPTPVHISGVAGGVPYTYTWTRTQ